MIVAPRLIILTIAAGLTASPTAAQSPAPDSAGTASRGATASVAQAGSGQIRGVVLDERGTPLRGAMVSALGSTTAVGVTDSFGRFTFGSLPPGAYLLRAHMGGYATSSGRRVEVTSEAGAMSTIALRRTGAIGTAGSGTDTPVLAGFGPTAADTAAPGEASEDPANDDHSETAWRLRHIKRSVLKDAGADAGTLAESDQPEDLAFVPGTFSFLGRAVGTSARVASNFFDAFPFSGQFNLLTTGAFDSPQQLFSADGFSRSVAYLSIGATAGSHGDWAIRGAMTQGDLASWILAGSYVTRMPARHAYDLGMSYSMQRYDGGNPAALAAVTDGTRNAGEVYAFDRWTISRRIAIGYGARYARYDYLEGAEQLSPRITATISPVNRFRIQAVASRRTLAPGAEEFVPPVTPGLWLPPERTFAPLSERASFSAERAQHYEVALEHDLTDGIVVGFRTFYQRVDDQLATLFGVRVPAAVAADLGHYYVGNAGDFEARGWGVSVSHAVTSGVRGSIGYTETDAVWLPSGDSALIAVWAPSAARRDRERLHDLTTSLQTDIPVTATRLFVLYRINTGFAASEASADHGAPDARFDVQVNQALPFLNFTSTRWEMLIAVRNLFRDALSDGSSYDELLVVRPPKRIVGGLLVRF